LSAYRIPVNPPTMPHGFGFDCWGIANAVNGIANHKRLFRETGFTCPALLIDLLK